MELLLCLGLMALLFILNSLLLVPSEEYGTSPAAVTRERVLRKIEDFYQDEDGSHWLSVVNRSTGDMLSTTIFAGTFFSILIILIAQKWLGGWSLLAVFPAFTFGAYQTRRTLQTQFNNWQMKMCDGLSPLLEFLKSFFKLEGVTTREAMEYSLEHLPEPLKSELTVTVEELSNTGDPQRAFDNLANKVKHRLFYAVCFRLGVGWENKITPNLCDDLLRQIENDKDVQIAKATSLKSGAFAMLCALGLPIIALVYLYPISKYMGLSFNVGLH